MRAASTLVLVSLVVSAWLLPRPTRADSLRFVVRDLGPIDLDRSSRGLAINAEGMTAGSARNDQGVIQAFRATSAGAWQGLGSLIGPDGHSEALGINDGGQVVGTSENSDGRDRAFRTDGTGGLEDLGTLSGGRWSRAVAINNAGMVAGTGDNDRGEVYALRILGDGTIEDLGTLSGSFSSEARDINDLGVVVGVSRDWWGTSRGFISTEEGLEPIGSLPGGSGSVAQAINEDGLIVGHAGDASGRDRAFVGRPGTLTALGLPPGAFGSYGLDLNERGDVVGRVELGDGPHAFLWTEETGMIDLNDRISGDSGWVLASAFGINDALQIVGTGRFGGQERAFLLSPSGEGPPGTDPTVSASPEPSTMLMVALGGGGLTLVMIGRSRPRRGPAKP